MRIPAAILALAGSMLALACDVKPPENDVSQPLAPALQIDSLWNYAEPAASEARFRELLPSARAGGDRAYLAELLTQIARAQGLQQKYAEAGATLDEADSLIAPDMARPRVRADLERGRVLNSSGQPQASIPHFEQAFERASEAGLENLAVDAAHMLGIAQRGDAAIAWNERAMQLAERAKDPEARRWLGPLYNNLGWTYHDLGRFEEARALFEKDFGYRTSLGKTFEAGIARWSMARALRSLGRVDEALQIQSELLEDPERSGKDAEGYTREEIAECLLLLGREAEAKPHFARAWELLRDDPWLKQDEPERLARLERLGK